MTATRWPVHPAPIPGEASSSWLSRLAAALHLDVDTLFADVGYHLDGPDDLDGLDVAVPARFARRLATRTGVSARRIRQTGLTGYQPGILGTARARDQFAAYTREFSILLPPGDAATRTCAAGWLASHRPDPDPAGVPAMPPATAPPYPYLLAWAIPIMLTCLIHRRWLEFYADPPRDYLHAPYSDPPPPSPAVEAMDTRTWQAITTGRATLPGGAVPARIWFRLLRAIIEEVAAIPPESDDARAVLQHAWGSGRPVDAEKYDWQPYEDLEPNAQDQVLTAAATAIAALQDGAITGHGNAAPPLPTGRHQHQTPACAAHF